MYEKKLEAEFIPIAPRKRDYRTVNVVGVFYWRMDALDTDEYYKQDCKFGIEIFKLEVSSKETTSIMASTFSLQSKVKLNHLSGRKLRMMLDL